MNSQYISYDYGKMGVVATVRLAEVIVQSDLSVKILDNSNEINGEECFKYLLRPNRT